MSDMEQVKAWYPDAREIPDVDSSRYAPQIWSDDKGYLGKDWPDAASRLPREGGEAAEQPAPGIDWNNDEAVVKAAVPKALYEATTGTIVAYSFNGSYTQGEVYGSGIGLVSAWKNARQHPTVQAYERANRPAEGSPASEPQGELSMVEIIQPTNDELWDRIQKFIESSPERYEQDDALFAVMALRNQPAQRFDECWNSYKHTISAVKVGSLEDVARHFWNAALRGKG